MIITFSKYVFIAIFLGSAIGKMVGFDDTLIYFAGLTKISFPIITFSLWILIIIELIISVLVLMYGLQLKTIYISIQFLLVTFLFTNILFLILGVENCGCFGADIQSHPGFGILKTIFLIIIVYYLREKRFFPVWIKIRKKSW